MEKAIETLTDVEIFKPKKERKLRKCIECGDVSDKGLDIQGRNGKTDFLCEHCLQTEEL